MNFLNSNLFSSSGSGDSGGGGFNQVLSGLSSQLNTNQGSAPQSSGGGGGGTIGGIAGAALGSAILPGVGTVVGGFLGSTIGGLFGGGGVPGHENSDADKIANAVGITRQQAMDLCAMVEDEAGQGGPNFDDIVKDYASHPDEIIGLIPRYNRKHPEKAIYPQQMSSMSAVSQIQQVPTNAAIQVPSLATGTYMPNSVATANTPANPATANNTTTYALIGGGALALVIVLILLLKK